MSRTPQEQIADQISMVLEQKEKRDIINENIVSLGGYQRVCEQMGVHWGPALCVRIQKSCAEGPPTAEWTAYWDRVRRACGKQR